MISALTEFSSHFKVDPTRSDVSVTTSDGLLSLWHTHREIGSDVMSVQFALRFTSCPSRATIEELAQLGVELGHLIVFRKLSSVLVVKKGLKEDGYGRGRVFIQRHCSVTTEHSFRHSWGLCMEY